MRLQKERLQKALQSITKIFFKDHKDYRKTFKARSIEHFKAVHCFVSLNQNKYFFIGGLVA